MHGSSVLHLGGYKQVDSLSHHFYPNNLPHHHIHGELRCTFNHHIEINQVGRHTDRHELSQVDHHVLECNLLCCMVHRLYTRDPLHQWA